MKTYVHLQISLNSSQNDKDVTKKVEIIKKHTQAYTGR